jgi:hypothetical protein
MANIAIVNSKIATLGTLRALTLTAADETTDVTAQKFVYTPTGKDNKICFVIYNGAAHTMTATVTAGVGAMGAPALVNTVPASVGHSLIQLETGLYRTATGTVELSLLPTEAVHDLTNDHAATVGVIELQ